MGPIATEFPKWQEWAKCIKQDVQNRLVYPRQIFRTFTQVVNANEKHVVEHDGDVFVTFVAKCYVSHTAMAIRSHVKLDNKSISLLRLLMQIRDCAGQFTFQFFLEQFPIDPAYVDWQPVTFAPFSDDGRSVSSKIVQRDIEILRTLTIQIEELADRTLAHLDKRGFDGKVTFGELDACVDAFDKLVCKYLKLTAGAGYATLEPTILCDWQKIFTVPLDIRNSGQSSGEWDE